jgi:hypothetical protein
MRLQCLVSPEGSAAPGRSISAQHQSVGASFRRRTGRLLFRHAVWLITTGQYSAVLTEDHHAARITRGCGTVEPSRSRQVVITCNDALEASTDATGRAEFDAIFSFGHIVHLCADERGDQGESGRREERIVCAGVGETTAGHAPSPSPPAGPVRPRASPRGFRFSGTHSGGNSASAG